MTAVAYRVDGRMLHGQICTAWGRTLHIDEYIIVNETVANNPMQVTLLELAAMGTTVTVCSPKDAAEKMKNSDFSGNHPMFVFKYIQDAAEFVKEGCKIDELGIGGMYDEAGKNKVKYEMNLFVNDEDKECLKFLDSQGIRMTFQIVPEYKAKMVKDLVKY